MNPKNVLKNLFYNYFLTAVLDGGVFGRELPSSPACATRCRFSAGFKIWKEHIKVSSTLIMADSIKKERNES